MKVLLTKEQVMKKYDIKENTFYKYRRECLKSEYSDAVIIPSGRKTLIDAERWEEYWEYLSDKRKKRLYGIDIQVEEVKKMNIQVAIQNLDEFLKLVEKAEKQASTLKTTLKEIDDFEFKTK